MKALILLNALVGPGKIDAARTALLDWLSTIFCEN